MSALSSELRGSELWAEISGHYTVPLVDKCYSWPQVCLTLKANQPLSCINCYVKRNSPLLYYDRGNSCLWRSIKSRLSAYPSFLQTTMVSLQLALLESSEPFSPRTQAPLHTLAYHLLCSCTSHTQVLHNERVLELSEGTYSLVVVESSLTS
jgi:hypothetical protein